MGGGMGGGGREEVERKRKDGRGVIRLRKEERNKKTAAVARAVFYDFALSAGERTSVSRRSAAYDSYGR